MKRIFSQKGSFFVLFISISILGCRHSPSSASPNRNLSTTADSNRDQKSVYLIKFNDSSSLNLADTHDNNSNAAIVASSVAGATLTVGFIASAIFLKGRRRNASVPEPIRTPQPIKERKPWDPQIPPGEAHNPETLAIAFRRQREALPKHDNDAAEDLNQQAGAYQNFYENSHILVKERSQELNEILNNPILEKNKITEQQVENLKSNDEILQLFKNNSELKNLDSLFDRISYTMGTTKPFQMEKNTLGDSFNFQFKRQFNNYPSKELNVLQIYIEGQRLGKEGDGLNQYVLDELTNNFYKNGNFVSEDAKAGMRSQFRLFLEDKWTHIERYAQLEKYVKTNVNDLELKLSYLINSDRISDTQLTLLYYKFRGDEYIAGKISEAAKNRNDFQNLSGALAINFSVIRKISSEDLTSLKDAEIYTYNGVDFVGGVELTEGAKKKIKERCQDLQIGDHIAIMD